MITQQLLKELFNYNPDTGQITRIKDRRGSARAGDIAGTYDKYGYIVVTLQGKMYKAHRLAWLYQTGSWPEGHIDHLNNIRDDNRWSNLRSVSQRENNLNRKPYHKSVSKYKGVCWLRNNNKWMAALSFKGKRYYLGLFDCEHEAAIAYNEKVKEVAGEHAWINEIDYKFMTKKVK